MEGSNQAGGNIPNEDTGEASPPEGRTGRRRALHSIVAGLAAAAGAAVLGAARPNPAVAAPLSPSPSSNVVGTPAILATGTNGASWSLRLE
jgi:hypothetical protein